MNLDQETQRTSKDLDILKHPEATIRLEYDKTFAIAHIKEADDFNKTTYKWMREQVKSLHDFVTTAGYDNLYAGIDKGNKTTMKLCSKLGFTHLGENSGIEVYVYGGLE